MNVDLLGDPRLPGGTRYALCVRDGAGALVFRAELPTCAGGTGCWRTTPGRGLSYRATGAGVRALAITSGGPNGVGITATARGRDVVTTPLPPALPLVVQLEADTGACWMTELDASTVATSGSRRFKAATP